MIYGPNAPGPGHERIVNFRRDSSGGIARRDPLPGANYPASDRLYILVHGFNVSEDDAYASYGAFEANLARLLAGRADWPRLRERIAWLLWPGDARPVRWLGRLRDPVKAMIYGPRVGHVQRWTPDLATWLERRRGVNGARCTVVLVGHSLGCRVILEALRVLRGRHEGPNKNEIPLVLLMAAAVPVVHLEPGGLLRDALRRTEEVDVLHSTKDKVLNLAFRGGQHFGELLVGGLLPEAVGRHGRPGAPPFALTRRVNLDHGDYWHDEGVARHFLQRIGKLVSSGPPTTRVPVAKRLAEREAVPEREPVGERIGPSSRPRPGRQAA